MRMRQTAWWLGMLLAAHATSASAVDLVIDSPVATGFSPSGFDVVIPGFTPSNGTIGTLQVTGAGVVTYTYLGKEAGYTNRLFNVGGTLSPILDSHAVGSFSVQTYLASGALSFSFSTVSPAIGVTNGSATSSSPTFAIFAGGSSAFKWVLGYDDGGAGPDRDFDDMVIGVTVVPEPEAYGLALAGMSVVAVAIRRRQGQVRS